jgi:hypothetical protein
LGIPDLLGLLRDVCGRLVAGMKFQFSKTICDVCGKNRVHHNAIEKQICSSNRKKKNSFSETKSSKRKTLDKDSINYLANTK